ncbi:MAG TPA: PadR family transcriptional regulator [Thermoguttaceae bacterium]|nr:PadR family transcriptional regulator [Thermoguttaceae bacterium]
MTEKRTCPCEGHTLDRLLQPSVMALLKTGPLHAYALVEQLKDSPLMMGCRPDPSGVYRLLNRLEKQGLVEHDWGESKQGPSKRLYRLTSSGKKCLRKWVKTLDAYQRAIARLVSSMR